MTKHVERMSFKLKDVPFYCTEHNHNIIDIIVFVRDKIPDPHIPVIVDTDRGISGVDTLAAQNIYLSEESFRNSSTLGGLSKDCACVINIDRLASPDVDSVEEFINNFIVKYTVSSFTVYLTGTNMNALYQLFVDIPAHEISQYKFQYPDKVLKRVSLKDNGFDIAPVSAELDTMTYRKSLTWDGLSSKLYAIVKDVSEGKKEVQCLSSYRTRTTKLLSTYLNMHPGVVIGNTRMFLLDLMQSKFIYPVGKLSMFERIRFLKMLPKVVGFSNPANDEVSLLRVVQLVFPDPVLIYIREQNKIIEYQKLPEGMRALFHPNGLPFRRTEGYSSYIYDSRNLFPTSTGYFLPKEENRIRLHDYKDDHAADVEICKDFANIERVWIQHQVHSHAVAKEAKERGMLNEDVGQLKMEPLGLSFKNTYIVKFRANSEEYTAYVYCKDSCGILVKVHSELCIEGFPMLVPEEHFYRLVDAKFAQDVIEREYVNTTGANTLIAKSYSSELITRDAYALEPAIPIDVSLAINMLPMELSYLSYYDKILRCRENIVPIVRDVNSELYEHSPVLNVLHLNHLRDDLIAGSILNSCGTIDTASLLVSYEAFKGVNLL